MVGGSVRVLGVALLGIRLSSASAVSGVGDSVGMLKVNSTPPGRGLGAFSEAQKACPGLFTRLLESHNGSLSHR